MISLSRLKEMVEEEMENKIKELEEKLLRKEQECEEKDKDIKFLLEKLDLSNNRIQDCELYWDKEKKNLKQQLDQIKAENEELKQFLSKEPLAIQALQSAYSDYRKRSEVFFEMIGEYKQTLAEIKEIAEANKNYKFKIPEISCAGDTLELKFDVLEQILQIISEVEDVRN